MALAGGIFVAGSITNLTTNFTGRKPTMHAGDWWFQSTTPGLIDSQSIMNNLLDLYASKGVDFILYDEYGFYDTEPPVVALGSPYTYMTSDRDTTCKINNAIAYHKLSPSASKCKFAVDIIAQFFAMTKAGVIWGWATEHATAIRALFDDPNYQRVRGKPLVALHGGDYVATDSTTFLSQWTSVIKPILGDIWLVVTDNSSTAFTNFNADAKGTYGNAGTGGIVSGRNAFSVYMAGSNSVTSGNDVRRLKAATINVTGSDARPRGGSPAFSDYPAHDDLLNGLRGLATNTPDGRDVSEVVISAAADEFDEGEIADPTRDNGTEVLDAIARWKGKLDLSTGRDGFGATAFGAGTYTYSMSFSTKYWTKTGTWTTGAGIDLAYQNEEQRSSTTGDTAVLVKAFTRIEIRGKRGPAQGRFTISIDGGGPTTVDTGGAAADDVSFFTVSGLSYAAHTVTITILGDHVLGSGNQVALQRAKITYLPT